MAGFSKKNLSTWVKCSKKEEFVALGEMLKKEEFVDLDEMRKLLVAGDPSDSDPGFEVPQVVNRMNYWELMSFISI